AFGAVAVGGSGDRLFAGAARAENRPGIDRTVPRRTPGLRAIDARSRQSAPLVKREMVHVVCRVRSDRDVLRDRERVAMPANDSRHTLTRRGAGISFYR